MIKVAWIGFCLFLQFSIVAQDSAPRFEMGTALHLHPIDFWHTFEFQAHLKKVSPLFSVGYGINRTLFQRRFFPHFCVELPIKLISSSKFNLGVGPSVKTYFLQLNRAEKSMHFWHEYMLGYRISYGKRWKFTHGSAAGFRMERFQSELTNQAVSHSSFSYQIHLGVSYALD